MKIVGIDPSFSRTGLACIEDGSLLEFKSVTSTDSDIYDISKSLYHANELSAMITAFLEHHQPDTVIIEYPVLATRSGAYLGLIQQALYNTIKTYHNYLVPSLAITSFTKLKSKSELVKRCKDKYNLKKINHDEASAVILCELAVAIKNKSYNNTYKTI